MADESLEIDIRIQAAEGAKSLKDLKKSIKDLQSAALEAGAAGQDALADKYVKAAGMAQSKIVQLKDDINDVTIGANKMQAITGIATTIAGGFAAATGAAALFGESQEEIQKQLVKVQAAQALLSGLQEMSELGEQARLVKIIALKQAEALQTRLAAAAESESVIIRNAAVVAQKALNAVMNANPIALVVTAVLALVAAYKLLSEESTATAEAMVAANDKALKSSQHVHEQEIALAKARGENTDQLEIDNEKRLQRKLKAEIDYLNKSNLADDEKAKKREELTAAFVASTEKEAILIVTKNKNEVDEEKKKEDEKLKIQKKATDDRLAEKLREDQLTEENHQKWLQDKERRGAEAIALGEKHAAEQQALDDAKMLNESNMEMLDAEAMERELIADFNKTAALRDGSKERIAQDQKEFETKMAIANAEIGLAQASLTTLTEFGSAFIKDQKKLEKFNKTAALIQIGIDTAKAISAIVAASAANPANAATAGVAGAIQMAAGIISVMANIAKAKKILQTPANTPPTLGSTPKPTPFKAPKIETDSGGGGGTTTGGDPARGGVPKTSFSPQIGTMAKDCNCPQVGSGSTMLDENGNPISSVVKAVVVESDITASQKTIAGIKARSTF